MGKVFIIKVPEEVKVQRIKGKSAHKDRSCPEAVQLKEISDTASQTERKSVIVTPSQLKEISDSASKTKRKSVIITPDKTERQSVIRKNPAFKESKDTPFITQRQSVIRKNPAFTESTDTPFITQRQSVIRKNPAFTESTDTPFINQRQSVIRKNPAITENIDIPFITPDRIERQTVTKQVSRQIPTQSLDFQKELEEDKSIINNVTGIKNTTPKVKPDLCKTKAHLCRQPKRQAAFKAAKNIQAALSEETAAEEILSAKKARTDKAASDDRVLTEIEPVGIIVPEEEIRNNYKAAEELVITKKVPGEATAAINISENTEKQNQSSVIETPVPNLSEWEIYNELEKYLDGI